MPSLANKQVGPIGFGLMRMTWTANPPPREQCFAAMDTALSRGANFWNGGELYGKPDYNSLHLLHDYFTAQPEKAGQVVLSIKGGLKVGELVPDGSEANIRRSVDECLRVLGDTKTIDIFECARQDPNTDIEHTVRVLADLVKEGKIGGIGLSEADEDMIRRAHKVHPIAAVEVELSLFTTDILHNGVARACAELDIPIVAYAPLAWGMLTGAVAKSTDFAEGDHRRHMKKFQDAAMEQNIRLVDEVNKLAARKGVAPVQIALAWILSLSEQPGMPTIIPIPGGSTKDKVAQNLQRVRLDEGEMAEIGEILKRNPVVGARY